MATVATYALHDQLNLVNCERGRECLPILDHVGGLAGGRQIDRDRPPVTYARGALDQPQRLVLADELGVAGRVDENLWVHRPSERSRPGQHGLSAWRAIPSP